jgi:hypothetical protein
MEDVHALQARGSLAEQSFMFVVDSASRNMLAYPSASEYVVDLPVPLRNVFAVDLVDATVPRTEYAVEAGRNAFVYALTHQYRTLEAATNAGAARRVHVPPGDYNLPQLAVAFNQALGETAPLRMDFVSDPPEVTNRVRLVCTEPFAVFMRASTIRNAIGFGAPSLAPGGWLAPGGGAALYAPECARTAGSDDVFFSVPATSISAPELAYAGPVAIEVPEYEQGLPAGQRFTAAASGRALSVSVRAPSNAAAVQVTLVDLETDEVVARTTVAPGTSTAAFLESDGGGGVVVAGQVYAILLDRAPGEDAKVYRAESYEDDPAAAVSTTTTPPSWSSSSGMGLCVDLSVGFSGHAVEAPGQVDLTGERYVLVRSPDIEQHMHRHAAAFDRMSPGLGMCKLGGFGYREERFNYLAYGPRRFHPVGKLQSLRVRLEKRDGSLYNSHGINHTLLFVVKMYSPNVVPENMPGATSKVPSTLHPRYVSDPRLSSIAELEDRRRRQQ